MQLKNDLILKAARGEKTERTPVWLMRQAGRILPEYREIREKLSGFKELVQTPELAAEVTIQPVDILDVDAAIIFSDILVIPEAMGLDYQMVEKKGPLFEEVVNTDNDLKKIHISDGTELDYVYEAIRITKKNLDQRVPLIGFAGAPWTIMAYMVEGSGSKTFSKARRMLYNNPGLSDRILNMITQSTINYLKKQIDAGADMLQIFDSWAGILPPDQYSKFSLKYINEIVNEVNEVPVTVFAKGAWFALEEIAKTNCNTIGIDWNTDPTFARQVIKSKTLQGNMDPCLLYADEKEIISSTKEMMKSFEGVPHIANLGHGVYPDTNPEKVKLFIETVKNY
jgi:uroporphyrinogen decarboxylase